MKRLKKLIDSNKPSVEDTHSINPITGASNSTLFDELHLNSQQCEIFDVNDKNKINPEILEQYEFTKTFLKNFIIENCKDVKIIENNYEEDQEDKVEEDVNTIDTIDELKQADPFEEICLEGVFLDIISKNIELHDTYMSIALIAYFDGKIDYFKRKTVHKYYYAIRVYIKSDQHKLYQDLDKDNLEQTLMVFFAFLNGDYKIQKNGQVKLLVYKNPRFELVQDKDGKYITKLSEI